MLDILAPFIRILVLWAFTRFATLGYLTPEDASELTKAAMDAIMYGLPLLYGIWAARQAQKASKPERIIEKAAALPEVRAVEVKSPALADSLGPKVIS